MTARDIISAVNLAKSAYIKSGMNFEKAKALIESSIAPKAIKSLAIRNLGQRF